MENLLKYTLFYFLVGIVILLALISLGLFIYYLHARYMFNYHLDDYFSMRKLTIRRVTPKYAELKKPLRESKNTSLQLGEKDREEAKNESQQNLKAFICEGEVHDGSRCCACSSGRAGMNQVVQKESIDETCYEYKFIKKQECEANELYADVPEIISPNFV